MPKFLNNDELYRILQRELPQGVYADGAPSAFFTTADMYAVADCAATGYGTLERIYFNYFPQFADERQPDWEIKAFGHQLDVSLTLQERRDRVIARLRRRRGNKKSDYIDIVKEIIGEDKLVELARWGAADGGWILDESELDISTIFFGGPVLATSGANACELGAAGLGLSPQDYADAQEDAYTYSILIYGYTLTESEYREVDLALKEGEYARSQHVIYSGLDPADMINPVDVELETEGGDTLETEGGDDLLL